MKSSQDIFDLVIQHLRDQGPCMLNGTVACRYRGSNGMRCAIGAIIPDELYLPSMERNLVPSLIHQMSFLGKRYEELYLLFKSHEKLITHLQIIHDNEKKSSWEVHWKFIAMTYGLRYSLPLKNLRTPSDNGASADSVS